MARILKFVADDKDKFELFMQGFNQTMKAEKNPRLASRIHKKLDEISHPKYDLDSIISGQRLGDQSYSQRALMLSARELNDNGGEIVLEDAEFDYLKECIKQANWSNWIAVQGYAIEEWLDGIKAVNLRDLNAIASTISIDPVEHHDRSGGAR